MIIDRIREDMSVISADDCCIGFVNELLGDDKLTITSISAGYGYDHVIPLSWVSEVDKYVYLDKTSAFVAANWEHASSRSLGKAPSASRGYGQLSARQLAGNASRPQAA